MFYKKNQVWSPIGLSPAERTYSQAQFISTATPLIFHRTITHYRYDIWLIMAMHLFALISHFSSLALVRGLQDDEEDVRLQHEVELPHARFLRYMQVKKDIVQRGDSSQRPPWEFGLYSEI